MEDCVKNKKFANVKDKLLHIQKNCKEPVLFEDLKQLFRAKGFSNVEVTHGSKEYGKDLVFSKFDSGFEQEFWYGVIVKNKNATQNDFVLGGEIAQQIEMAFNIPFKTSNGTEVKVTRLFIVINGSVTDNSRDVLKHSYNDLQLSNISIWNYQKLGNELDTHVKELFLDTVEPSINIYSAEQIKRLSDISKSNQLFDLDIQDIDDIFINVQTSYSRHLRSKQEYVEFDGESSKRNSPSKIDEIDGVEEILSSRKHFIVHGIATSGKTLLLKRLGIKALKDLTVNAGVFYFEAPELLKSSKAGVIDFDKEINQQFKNLSGGDEFNADSFSKIILLIDSIDDVRNDSIRIELFENVDGFIGNSKHSNLQVVVATKTTEILDNENLLNDFEKCELLPFNVGQAFKLVSKIIPNNNSKSEAFTKAIKSSMLDSEILRTPLALTLMAILYRDDSIDLEELPANITELYNKFVDTYLDRWDSSKGISQQYKYEQTKIILSFIAYEMHHRGDDRISVSDVQSTMQKMRSLYNYEELNDIDSFISHLKDKRGVFNYDESVDEFFFFNHLFQEYFASLYIDEKSEGDLKDNFFDEWWENTIVFYCGKNPKRDLFLLDVGHAIIPNELKEGYLYLRLLSKCLQASHSVLIKSRLAIVKRLVAEFDKFCIKFLEEGKKGKTFAASTSSVDMIISFRTFFHRLFSSKHIANEECLSLFEDLLVQDELNLSDTTRYCIAYFYSFLKDDPSAIETFVGSEDLDIMWQRIGQVDLGMLNYKKENLKAYQRISRRVRKNQVRIQFRLLGLSTEVLLDE